MIQHKNLNTELLTSVGFDMAATTLEVAFKDGRTVQYLYVPMTIYMELMSIADKDAFFQRTVEGKFQTRPAA